MLPDTQSWARFAPSPTGPLHLGNLQTALAAWLQARVCGAGFILRIEDLDSARCKTRYIDSIVTDLRWLGIDWDIGPEVGDPKDYLQSLRTPLYLAALEQLASEDMLFPCSCTRRELADLASAPHGPLGQIYPGTCRASALSQNQALQTSGSRNESIRFRCPAGHVVFVDQLVGRLHCELPKEVGDFVVSRRDGVIAYHLAVVVDDIAMRVTDVLRGEDLLWSVFPQLCLYRALDAVPPRYWHVPLRRDESGKRLSKRAGGETLQSLITAGYSRESVIGLLAAGLGLVDKPQSVSLMELVAGLDESTLLRALRGRTDSGREEGL